MGIPKLPHTKTRGVKVSYVASNTETSENIESYMKYRKSKKKESITPIETI